MVKRKEIFLFIILIMLGGLMIYIYDYIKEAKVEMFDKIEKDKINQVVDIYNNIKTTTMKEENILSADDMFNFLSKKENRIAQEKKIATLLSPSIKYIYLLMRDKKGRFRYLLDASKIDKANFYQKFDVDSPKYDLVYKIKQPQVIRHEDIENLCLTYLYPLIIDNNVVAILSFDITNYLKQDIDSLIKPLESFFIILMIFIILLILMTTVQVIHYFVTRKKIFTDPLTQLFNRNYLQEIIPMLNLEHYSIAMLDLDRFKSINDTYGHKAGDYILSQSSQIFKNSIRDTDILIRYGGEEFLLFIYHRDESNIAIEVCERVRKNISKNLYKFDTNDIKMSVSIGIHKKPYLEKSINEAIKKADKMLYIAKSEGRNKVIAFEDNMVLEDEKSYDIDFVKEAILDDRVICHYQPIYDYNSNKIIKYEALVRIKDKNGDIIYPMSFLPNLKHTNIHYKLTQRILSLIFDKFESTNKSVSINLSFLDLINKDIENTINDRLKKNLEFSKRITFEILESDEIENLELFKEKIKFIHSLGSKVSVDDFGSGYSNFRTVLDIEADYLKIDGSLIKNIDKNDKDFKVVKSIIHFAKVSDMLTIAEFVHSKDVYDKLKMLDLDYMQGYYISKPIEKLATNEDLFQD